MPLVVKDFTWDQNETTIFVTVPLKGVKSNKVDIFSSEEYLKVRVETYCIIVFRVTVVHVKSTRGNIALYWKEFDLYFYLISCFNTKFNRTLTTSRQDYFLVLSTEIIEHVNVRDKIRVGVRIRSIDGAKRKSFNHLRFLPKKVFNFIFF